MESANFFVIEKLGSKGSVDTNIWPNIIQIFRNNCYIDSVYPK